MCERRPKEGPQHTERKSPAHFIHLLKEKGIDFLFSIFCFVLHLNIVCRSFFYLLRVQTLTLSYRPVRVHMEPRQGPLKVPPGPQRWESLDDDTCPHRCSLSRYRSLFSHWQEILLYYCMYIFLWKRGGLSILSSNIFSYQKINNIHNNKNRVFGVWGGRR